MQIAVGRKPRSLRFNCAPQAAHMSQSQLSEPWAPNSRGGLGSAAAVTMPVGNALPPNSVGYQYVTIQKD
jgi:hypothetical protein